MLAACFYTSATTIDTTGGAEVIGSNGSNTTTSIIYTGTGTIQKNGTNTVTLTDATFTNFLGTLNINQGTFSFGTRFCEQNLKKR